jgi:hypothetical protein
MLQGRMRLHSALAMPAHAVTDHPQTRAHTLPDSRRIVGIVLDTAPSSGIDGPPPADTVWTDVLDLGIQGRGWNASELNSPFNRCVPLKPLVHALHA